MSEPFQVKLPVRMGYHDFKLLNEAFRLRGIDAQKVLEIERRPLGPHTMYIVHGPKKQEG